jgi:hypothetical protein
LVTGFPLQQPGFDARSGDAGFVVDRVALGQVSSKSFSFPFHQMLHTHLSSGAGTVSPLVADMPGGLSLTLPVLLVQATKFVTLMPPYEKSHV